MKKRILYLALLVSVLLTACRPASPTATPLAAPAASPENKPTATAILELVGPVGSRNLTLDEVKALPAVEGWAGTKNSVGRVFPPLPHKGVGLVEICKLVGGLTEENAVEIVAKDGYAMTMSYREAAEGALGTYDPATGDEIKYNDRLQVTVAYEREGKPLPEDADGILRLVVISARNNQVTDGHWSVKWVTKIVVKAMTRDWTFLLDGKLKEDMDRTTFESGATPCCHRRIWKDDEGHIWSGIPLWHLVGRVDDDLRHQAGAFNDGLAQLSYTIDIVAADGYTISLDSKRVRYNNNLIVVNQMDDKPLEEKYFPLRLVGSDVTKKEMVGQIASIVLHLPTDVVPANTPLPVEPRVVPTPPGGVVLTIAGKVERELAFTMEELKAMQRELKTEHPIDGLQTYQGAPMQDLLNKAGMRSDVKFVVLVSGDGARTATPIGLIQQCPDCLVSFAYDGTLGAVMPTMDCYFWIKDLVRIELE